MHAEIIAVGSEITSGQKLDTNSRWIGERLSRLGIAAVHHTAVDDDLGRNVAALRIAVERSGLVLVTGGLGPTQDDLTREALAEAAGAGLVEDAESLAQIEAFFARRHRAMTPRNRVQAARPDGSEPMANPVGTAPGIWMKVGGAFVGCLPGVPSEMRTMFDEQVVPRLRSAGLIGRTIAHRVIHLYGKGESEIESMALDLTARGRVPEVGITASDATISFRIRCEGATEEEARALGEPTAALIYERFADLIVGEGDEDVPHALVKRLRSTGSTIAVAESCTGGLVAKGITDLAGVSDVFLGGVVSYANAAKSSLLGVPPGTLESHGAVSAEVAEAMARGVRERLGSTIGLAITGVAGPGGGTEEKPVGLVYLGVATEAGTQSRRLELGPEQPREIIRSRAAKAAMNFARIALTPAS